MVIITALIVAILFLTGVFVSLVWRIVSCSMPAIARPSGVLVYHQIQNKPVLGTSWTTPALFKRQLRFLSHLPLVCVPFSRHISTPCKEEFSITFDDGLACLHKNAVPLLREYNFPAIFFIVSGFVGKRSEWDVYNQEHMSASQVRELLNLGFEIGSHTATHPDLTKLSPNHIKQELESSKKTLEDLLGSGIDYLSYPFGRFNETVQGIAEECGYLGAVTINPSLKSSLRDMFAIPGNAVYVFDGLYNLESKASGNNLFWIEVLKNKITNRFASGTSLFVPHHLYKREL